MEELRNRVLRAVHGDVIDDLTTLEKAIEITSVTLEAAEFEVMFEAGVVVPRQWGELVPWLRKGGGTG